LANKARSLTALAFGNENKFMHTDIGFNYRMTNLQAAVGCGQMDRVDHLIKKRIEISNFYTKELSGYKDYLSLPLEMEYAKNVYWMYHIVLREHLVDKRSFIMNALKEAGIETREGFIPYNLQKIFINKGWTKPEDCPNANKVAYASFYLPTGPDISEEELHYVVKNFKRILKDIV
jgi:perosamine synthetase